MLLPEAGECAGDHVVLSGCPECPMLLTEAGECASDHVVLSGCPECPMCCQKQENVRVIMLS